MPCAGAEAFLVMSVERAQALSLPYAVIKGAVERHNAYPADPMPLRGGWAMERDRLYTQAGLAPKDMDFLETYDDYPVIALMQMEDLGFCGKGEGPEFIRKTPLTVSGGGLPHNTSGGQLSSGQAGAAGGFLGLTEALRQLTGQAYTQIAGAKFGLVSGYGMVIYDRCLCTAAAILARGDA
jgi:acetyl-CoA acetyltransferase